MSAENPNCLDKSYSVEPAVCVKEKVSIFGIPRVSISLETLNIQTHGDSFSTETTPNKNDNSSSTTWQIILQLRMYKKKLKVKQNAISENKPVDRVHMEIVVY